MDPKIAEYILEHRDRYTRASITEQLISAGHEPSTVDATWEALREGTPIAPPRRRGGGYVMTVYLLGLAAIIVLALLNGLQLVPFVVVLVLAYAVVGYLVARVWAPRATMGIGLALAVPFVFLLIGFGSCLAAIYTGALVPPTLVPGGETPAPTPASFVLPPIGGGLT
jgi:hypothetical protein